MSLLYLEHAERDTHGRSLLFTESSDPKGCLHTTETSGWPSYGSWTVHPHLTVMPIPGVGVIVRQHIPFNRAGFALRNLSGGVATNTDRVYQVELVGTCHAGGPGYDWTKADDAVLRDLARKVIVPMSQGLGIPLRALRFQAYPASYGARGKTNTVRLSGPAFDVYSGWLGHQHVPENAHGDPGAFPWYRMIKLIGESIVAGDIPHDVWAYDQDGERQQAWRYLQDAAAYAKTASAEAKAVRADTESLQTLVAKLGQQLATISAAVQKLAVASGADPKGLASAVVDELHDRTGPTS